MASPQPQATRHAIKPLQHVFSSHLTLFSSLSAWINQKSGAENISVFPQTYRDLLAKLGDCLTKSLEASVTQGSSHEDHEWAGQRGPSGHRPTCSGGWEGAQEKKPRDATHHGKQTACLCVGSDATAKEGLMLSITP